MARLTAAKATLYFRMVPVTPSREQLPVPDDEPTDLSCDGVPIRPCESRQLGFCSLRWRAAGRRREGVQSENDLRHFVGEGAWIDRAGVAESRDGDVLIGKSDDCGEITELVSPVADGSQASVDGGPWIPIRDSPASPSRVYALRNPLVWVRDDES